MIRWMNKNKNIYGQFCNANNSNIHQYVYDLPFDTYTEVQVEKVFQFRFFFKHTFHIYMWNNSKIKYYILKW